MHHPIGTKVTLRPCLPDVRCHRSHGVRGPSRTITEVHYAAAPMPPHGSAARLPSMIMMARRRTHEHRIRAEMRAARSKVSASVSALVTMARDPRAHRYQRHAARHARLALARARHVGPRRAMQDRRVRRQITIARRFARASAHPHRHSTRNRVIATGVAAAAMTGGVAYGVVRSCEPSATMNGHQ